jgi:hypothetical protein
MRPEQCCTWWPLPERRADLHRSRSGSLHTRRRRLTHLPRVRIDAAALRRLPVRAVARAAALHVAGLALAGLGIYWLVVQVLPATTAWTAGHGWDGAVIWAIWAGLAMSAVYATSVRGWYPAVYILHITALHAVWMAVAGPWEHPVLAVLAIGYLWTLLYLAARRAAVRTAMRARATPTAAEPRRPRAVTTAGRTRP